MLREIERLSKASAAEAKRKARKTKANKGREAVNQALVKNGTYSQAQLDALMNLSEADFRKLLKEATVKQTLRKLKSQKHS